MALPQYQTFWQRFWAGFIDALIFAPLAIPTWFIFKPQTPKWMILAWAVVFYLSTPVYSIYLHGRYGKTVGKRIMGVVVLDASEQRLPNFRQALIRDIVLVISQLILLANFFRVVIASGYVYHIDNKMGQFGYAFEWASEIWFWVEVVTMLSNRKRRALHDWLAGTVVVDEGAVSAPVLERVA